MIARVGDRARATSDADATWRADEQTLHDMLDRTGVLDLNDNFEFIIGRGKPIQAEGPEGGLRFPVTARVWPAKCSRRFASTLILSITTLAR
jgi:hypothetical protein